MAVNAVSGEQLAGLVDDLGGLVGHVVVEDADVTGVTLVAEDVFLDIFPGAASIHATQLLLADVGIALAVDDVESLLQFFAMLRLRGDALCELVAEVSPSLAAADGVEEGVGNLQLLLHIVLQGEGTIGGQLLVAGNGTFDGGETDDLDDLHAAGGVGHYLAGDVNDALQNAFVLAEIRVQHRLRQGEVYVEGILVAPHDAGAVVGFVLRDMCKYRIVLQ